MDNSNCNQLSMIYDYGQKYREKFNQDIINRDDNAIVNELLNIIKACERSQFFTIKLKSYQILEDPIEIHDYLYNYEEDDSRKNKGRKRENLYQYINMKDSDIKLLVVRYYTAIKDQCEEFEVPIAVPRLMNKYYFRIMGNMYSAMYQIVDGSTYNNSNSSSRKQSITLKTVFMPIRIYRNFQKLKTTNKEQITTTIYVSRIFNKNTPALKYILGKFGLNDALSFLGITCITITRNDPGLDDMYTFDKNGIYINVPKMIFDGNPLVQSVVTTIYRSIIKEDMYDELFTKEFWLCSLGMDFNSFTIEKGLSVCESLEGLYDPTTKDTINLPMKDKENIYCILRWMVREFSNLKIKDNLNISIKKIRYAPYIASLYAMKISKGIHRISDLGKRATIEAIRKALNTTPFFLINQITKCKLINYRNMVNDMDAFNILKVTFKGPSGVGDNENASIPENYRQVQPSHIGNIDMDGSSPTDPGLTTSLCPYVKLYNNFFSEYEEPNVWEEEFKELMDTYNQMKGIKEVISFKRKVTGEYDEDEEKIIDESLNCMRKLINPIYIVENTSETIHIQSPISFEYED